MGEFDLSQNRKMKGQNDINPLLKFLGKFENIPVEVQDAFNAKIKREQHSKRTILLKKGQVCERLYFMEKGLARAYYIENEKELTSDIVIDGEILVSFGSFVGQISSRIQIELLEDSTLYSISFDDLQYLYKTYPLLERIGRLIAEYHYQSMTNHAYMLRFDNSEVRYRKLVQNKPSIILRTPIGVIASYLGMTIETLSRIRAKSDKS